jgi:hypothetical protein
MPRYRRLGQSIAIAGMIIGAIGLGFLAYHFYTTPSLDLVEMVKAAGLGLIVAGIAAAMLAAAQMLTGGGRRRR